MRIRIRSVKDDNSIKYVIERKWKLFGWCINTVDSPFNNPASHYTGQVIFFIVYLLTFWACQYFGMSVLGNVIVTGVYLTVAYLISLFASKTNKHDDHLYNNKRLASDWIEYKLNRIEIEKSKRKNVNEKYGKGFCKEYPIYQISKDERYSIIRLLRK